MAKEIIETMINTTALALTSYGVLEVTSKGNLTGYLAILCGAGLEYLKYHGRKRKLWY
jgi:hypothetical protein